MLGGQKSYTAVPWFWSDQYELSLQIAGLPSDGAETVRRQISEEACLIFHRDAQARLVGCSGIGPGNSIARDVKLAEMLIARQAAPAAEVLADPSVALKSLLKG
jgi:3-phenylpropionate/trans-cinnamate dioxygenase ferredoxin reductase subunit